MEEAPALLSAGQQLVGCIERHPHSSQTFYLQAGIITIRQIDEGAAAAVSADG